MRAMPSFIPRHKAAEELGISITTFKRWEKLQDFPKPKIKLFRKDYFFFPEIVTWMNEYEEVKKKLGRQFYKQWKKNMSAMKTISNLYTRLQEKGGRLTESEVKDLSVALYVMENFRLFYVDWRK